MSKSNKYLKVNEETGELEPTVKYLPGHPKGYRFDGQAGYFKLGVNPLVDDKNKPIRKFEITPMAFRVFEGNMFGREKIELWFELFFIDETNALSSIMFNNTSANVLQNLVGDLFYEELSLLQVKLTVTCTEASNDKGKWFKAQFEFRELDKKEVEELKELEAILKPHNTNTLSDDSVYLLYEGTYFEYHVQNIRENKLIEA